jgi:hypothetical protein
MRKSFVSVLAFNRQKPGEMVFWIEKSGIDAVGASKITGKQTGV